MTGADTGSAAIRITVRPAAGGAGDASERMGCRMLVSSKMSDMLWVAAAIGLLVCPGAVAREPVASQPAPSRPVELCEAFPWDEPVEQTLTVELVLHWRRDANGVHRAMQPTRAGGR